MPRRPRALAHDLVHRLPLRPLAALAAIGLLTAAASTGGVAYQKRLNALEDQAAAARKRLGLTGPAACRKYPTPEMSFRKVVTVRPGQTFTLHATGRFVRGTAFVFDAGVVKLVRAKATARTATVVGRVIEDALPGPVDLVAISPVCGAETDRSAVVVERPTDWRLTMKNGWHVHLAAAGVGKDARCTATWSYRGRTRKMRCVLESKTPGWYTAHLGTKADARDISRRLLQAKADPTVAKKEQVVAGLMKEETSKCSTYANALTEANCIVGFRTQLRAAKDAVWTAELDAVKKAMKGVFGCLRVGIMNDGARLVVSGDACGPRADLLGGGTLALPKASPGQRSHGA